MDLRKLLKQEGEQTFSLYTLGDKELSEELIADILLPELNSWWKTFKLDGCTDSAFNTEGDPYHTFAITFTSSHYQEAINMFKEEIKKEASITGKLSARRHTFLEKRIVDCPCCNTESIYLLRARICSYNQTLWHWFRGYQ